MIGRACPTGGYFSRAGLAEAAGATTVSYLFGTDNDGWGGMSVRQYTTDGSEGGFTNVGWELGADNGRIVAQRSGTTQLNRADFAGLVDLNALGRTPGTDFSITVSGTITASGQQGFAGGVAALADGDWGATFGDQDSRGYYGILTQPNWSDREWRLNEVPIFGGTAEALPVTQTVNNEPFSITLIGEYDGLGNLTVTASTIYGGETTTVSNTFSDPHDGNYFGVAGRLRSYNDSEPDMTLNSMEITFVPEPATAAMLLGLGGLGLALCRRKRNLR